MIRIAFLLGVFAGVSPAVLATFIVPPVPRLVPSASPEPMPAETPPGSETPDDPEKTVERITKTAKEVGDRLKDQDTGSETLKAQEQLLKDIDSLLKQPPSPPPMPMPMPMGGGGGGGGGRPPRGQGSPPPPMGGNQKPMPMPMGGAGEGQPMPMPSGAGQDKKDMNTGKGSDQPNNPVGGTNQKSSSPNLPNEDPFTKQVWGHLPEKVRQQAMQSYREQFMPRYGDLLKQYYSTLAEKEKANRKK